MPTSCASKRFPYLPCLVSNLFLRHTGSRFSLRAWTTCKMVSCFTLKDSKIQRLQSFLIYLCGWGLFLRWCHIRMTELEHLLSRNTFRPCQTVVLNKNRAMWIQNVIWVIKVFPLISVRLAGGTDRFFLLTLWGK